MDEPYAVFIDRGPIAMAPDIAVGRPVGLDIAIGIAPQALRHSDRELRQHVLADLPSGNWTTIRIKNAGSHAG